MDDTQHSANLALAAYAETFLNGRRAVVFGDCSTGLAELLVERGARLVHVYDSDPSRVARVAGLGTHPSVSIAALGPSGLPVRDGAFDVGFVTNLALFAQPQEIVNRLRRALSARGVGFLAIPNAEQEPAFDAPPEAQGLTYYELYDLACGEFDEVRTLGQTPFVGYALADFGPDREEAFSIDTALVPGGAEEPEWFIAIVSHFPIHCDPFSVIQFPAKQVLSREADTSTQQESAQRALQLEQELDDLRRKEGPLERTKELLVQARAELDKRDAWVSELEARRAEADASCGAAEAQAQMLQRQLGQTTEELTALRDTHTRQAQELGMLRGQLTQSQNQLQAARERERALNENQAAAAKLLAEAQQRSVEIERLTVELAERNRERDEAKQAEVDQAQENADLEKQLIERSGVIQQLEKDLRRGDTFSAQLLHELEELREQSEPTSNGTDTAQGMNPGANALSTSEPARQRELDAELALLSQQLQQLTQTDARHVADLTAAQWTIQELEGRLAESLPSTRLEEELKQARADLQQQATLLAQARVATPEF